MMTSEHDTSANESIAEIVKVIERLWDEGYLFNGPAEEIASVAYRRWHTFERRHKKQRGPSLADRHRDLLKGLQAQFEPTGMYTRVEEWKGLVDALSPILDAELA